MQDTLHLIESSVGNFVEELSGGLRVIYKGREIQKRKEHEWIN